MCHSTEVVINIMFFNGYLVRGPFTRGSYGRCPNEVVYQLYMPIISILRAANSSSYRIYSPHVIKNILDNHHLNFFIKLIKRHPSQSKTTKQTSSRLEWTSQQDLTSEWTYLGSCEYFVILHWYTLNCSYFFIILISPFFFLRQTTASRDM